jgi:hypothetical protein
MFEIFKRLNDWLDELTGNEEDKIKLSHQYLKFLFASILFLGGMLIIYCFGWLNAQMFDISVEKYGMTSTLIGCVVLFSIFVIFPLSYAFYMRKKELKLKAASELGNKL